MDKHARLDTLLAMCRNSGKITVSEVSHSLGVSEMTIRRDFEELAQRGYVERIRGGIRLLSPSHGAPAQETPYFEKMQLHRSEKQLIAEAAADLIEPHDTVFLGSGSTCAAIARCLPAAPLRVVTNSLLVYHELKNAEHIELCIIGGSLHASSASTVGPISEEMLSCIGIDKSFIGANGIVRTEVYTSNIDEGRLQDLAFRRSAQQFIVADHSKIDQTGFYNFYRLDHVSGLITDGGCTPSQLDRLQGHTQVILAG